MAGDVEFFVGHPGVLQVLENIAGHFLGQVHCAVAVEDIDAVTSPFGASQNSTRTRKTKRDNWKKGVCPLLV